jgi:hypothetical protein
MRLTAEGDKECDYDFLASIELLILDQTDFFFMQNWDHLLHVFDNLHLQPQTTRNAGEIVNKEKNNCAQFFAIFFLNFSENLKGSCENL